jgi:nitronate monooxygenase
MGVLNPNKNLRTPLCDLLQCEYPILQAGMGGVARAELAAAVSEAGAYGYLGVAGESAERIAAEIEAVRARTERPFGINLVPAATDPALLDEELAACIECGVHSICFFWDVDRAAVERARAAGCRVLYQVGSVESALQAEAAGADAIIAQGVEAGGHVHGTLPTFVLLQQIGCAVSVPVVASGGIANGAGLVAAMALGGVGIHCGTAFLATREAFAHAYHKERIVAAVSGDTVHTDAFAIGWPPQSPVRVLHNSVTRALGDRLHGYGPDDHGREVIGDDAGEPVYRFSTESPLRTTNGELEVMALYAGEGAALIDSIPSAGDRVREMVTAAHDCLDGLRGR